MLQSPKNSPESRLTRRIGEQVPSRWPTKQRPANAGRLVRQRESGWRLRSASVGLPIIERKRRMHEPRRTDLAPILMGLPARLQNLPFLRLLRVALVCWFGL
jgi:hypothetical protein